MKVTWFLHIRKNDIRHFQKNGSKVDSIFFNGPN